MSSRQRASENELVDGVAEYWAYSVQHVNRKRENLGDDLVSEAIRACQEDPEMPTAGAGVDGSSQP
ncbi:hypothetical protein [Sporichthya sp.]|uniref:hypothetical protein n=1 Tax=Sporichthya sp. TaxID=65475 RepID=UPI0017B899C4|nr:hypothetical protein [Sporichthya sp.]MBA3741392.1 hypothetical protein [Sporichthya sp.]